MKVDPQTLKDKATEAFGKGRFEKAAEFYSEYCHIVPKDHQAAVRLGDAWGRVGKKDKAVGAYVKAAEGYARDGFLPRAIAAGKLVLEIDPSHHDVQKMLAGFYAKKSTEFRSPPPDYQGRVIPKREIEIDLASDDVEEVLPEVPASEPEPAAVAVRARPAEEPKPIPVLTPTVNPIAMPEGFTELELDESADSLLQAIESLSDDIPEEENHQVVEGILHEDIEEIEVTDAVPKINPDDLPKVPLFSDLPAEAFIALFDRCPFLRFEKDGMVFDQGQPGNSFFVICAGRVRIEKEESGAKKSLATLEEGAFFGEMALLSEAPRSASVSAMDDDTQLLEITAPVLKDLSKDHPHIAVALKKFCRQRMLSNLMNASKLFAPLTRTDRRQLVEKFMAREVPAGQVVIAEGTTSEGLFVVLSGEVAVCLKGENITKLREGEIFGEMSLLTKSPAKASVVATRRTSLLRLPKEEFDRVVMMYPKILAWVAELSDSRLRENAVRNLELHVDDSAMV